MNDKGIYWNVYRQLEKEFLSIAEIIHINDEQLSVYSMRIADLLLRTVVEIEALAKKLYFENGGTKANDKDLYFDTDCLQLLEEKWIISQKKVQVVSPYLYLENQDNIILTPLRKSYKRGTSGANWAKAYQSIKHNRIEFLSKGCLKNLLCALAALYLLNVYNLDERISLGYYLQKQKVDWSLGSSLFSVLVHPCHSISFTYDEQYNKLDDFASYVYIEKEIESSFPAKIDEYKKVEKEINKDHINALNSYLAKYPETEISELKNVAMKIKIDIIKKHSESLSKVFSKVKIEAVLNKNQDVIYNLNQSKENK